MKSIKVYCGKSIEDKCGNQKHPEKEVENAKCLVLSDNDEIAYSNSTDFVMAAKYIAKKYNIVVEFFLDSVSYGNSIEEIFADFNKSLDMINLYGSDED